MFMLLSTAYYILSKEENKKSKRCIPGCKHTSQTCCFPRIVVEIFEGVYMRLFLLEKITPYRIIKN